MRKALICTLFFLNLMLNNLFAQKITFAEIDKDDKGDMTFEILGKMNGNILTYKYNRYKHKITAYNNQMEEIETNKLDFLPEKTFNVDFVAYSDYAYMIYQYQKKSILYCCYIKLDALGKKITEPVVLDTTQISFFADNKIYTTLASENKEKIMVFKMQSKNDYYHLATKLFDKELNLTYTKRFSFPYNERRNSYDNFNLDNDGNLVFIKETNEGNRSTSNMLNIFVIKTSTDSINSSLLPLDKNYVDNVSLKIDNLNNRYLVNSFYFKKNRGNVDGIVTYTYEKNNVATNKIVFTTIYDSIRNVAKKTGQLRYALDDYFIQQVLVKKDGGYIVMAEDFVSQRSGTNNYWNRWDNYNNFNNYNSPYYFNNFYGVNRFNSFNNQSIRYYYNNILIISFDKLGNEQWSRVILKDQFDDGSDDFLSFSALPFNGEIHFLFNNDSKYKIIADQSINVNGDVKRNPTLKSEEKGHVFLPRFAKQISSTQVIIPYNYRGYFGFAKVDF